MRLLRVPIPTTLIFSSCYGLQQWASIWASMPLEGCKRGHRVEGLGALKRIHCRASTCLCPKWICLRICIWWGLLLGKGNPASCCDALTWGFKASGEPNSGAVWNIGLGIKKGMKKVKDPNDLTEQLFVNLLVSFLSLQQDCGRT